MKILFVGEIVAGAGRKTVQAVLPQIIKEYKPDLIISNAENLSGGRGFTEEKIMEMQSAGINYFTGGDHIFWDKDSSELLERLPVLRPANYPDISTPGRGHDVIDLGKKGEVLLINLMARTSSNNTFLYMDDPFKKLDEILDIYKGRKFSGIVVDFHGDYTSEKSAFGFYADGRVSAIVGTHTHVPTADNIALPGGTLYVTDVGMTGVIDSVLGVKKEIIINLFLTARNQRFEWEKTGRKAFRSVLLDLAKKEIIRIDKII